MPVHAYPALRLPRPDGRAVLDRMPGSDVPGDPPAVRRRRPVPFWASRPGPRAHELYDLDDDPQEVRDLAGTPTEADMADLLRAALVELGAPDDQLARLDLA